MSLDCRGSGVLVGGVWWPAMLVSAVFLVVDLSGPLRKRPALGVVFEVFCGLVVGEFVFEVVDFGLELHKSEVDAHFAHGGEVVVGEGVAEFFDEEVSGLVAEGTVHGGDDGVECSAEVGGGDVVEGAGEVDGFDCVFGVEVVVDVDVFEEGELGFEVFDEGFEGHEGVDLVGFASGD